jgi:AcrR family transcriptional regulator
VEDFKVSSVDLKAAETATEDPAAPRTSVAPAPARRSPGRPRSKAVRRAVLDAAYAILMGTDLASFSIESVALRSGISRPTIYRWWPRKGLLAIDCFLEAFRPQLAYSISGDATADLHALVGSLARALAGPSGLVAASVMAQAQSDPETRRILLHRFSEPLREESSKVLSAGVDQGRFHADLDIPRVLDAAVGAVYLRLLFGQSLDPAWARDLTNTLLKGCLAATLRPQNSNDGS